MAIFYLQAKVLSKQKAHSITKSFEYITRKNGSNIDDLVFKSFGNMPDFAKENPEIFWKNADLRERSNGTLGRSLIIALPKEANLQELENLINDFIKNSSIGKLELPFSCAIHNKNNTNPHLHLLFSERMIMNEEDKQKSPQIFFKQFSKRTKNSKKCGTRKLCLSEKKHRTQFLQDLKNTWEKYCNIFLKNKNLPLISQISNAPQVHLGPVLARRKQELERQQAENLLKIERNNAELYKIIEKERKEIIEAIKTEKQRKEPKQDIRDIIKEWTLGQEKPPTQGPEKVSEPKLGPKQDIRDIIKEWTLGQEKPLIQEPEDDEDNYYGPGRF